MSLARFHCLQSLIGIFDFERMYMYSTGVLAFLFIHMRYSNCYMMAFEWNLDLMETQGS